MDKFDEVLVTIGSNGLWQWLLLIFSAISTCAAAAGSFCQGLLATGGVHGMNFACTSTRRSRRAGSYLPLPVPEVGACVASSNNMTCMTFKFDSPYYNSTMVSEFEWICDEEWRVSLFQCTVVLAYACGLPIWALVNERAGRRLTAIFAAFGIFAAPLVNGHVAYFWQAMVCRFVMGFCSCGSWMALFLLNMEINVPLRRRLVKTVLTASFPVSIILSAILATVLPHEWRTLLRVVSALCFITIPIAVLLPESPRWLVQRGHYDRAKRTLQRGAKINRHPYPNTLHLREFGPSGSTADSTRQRRNTSTGDRQRQTGGNGERNRTRSADRGIDAAVVQPTTPKNSSPANTTATMKHWWHENVKKWKLGFVSARWSLLALLTYLWIINCAVLFAIPYYLLSGWLSRGNPYVLSVILGGVRLIVHVSIGLLDALVISRNKSSMHRRTTRLVGHRLIMLLSSTIGGIALLLIVAVPKRAWPATALGLLASGMLEASFICLYQLTLDLLPDSIGNLSLGVLSTVARLSTAGTPFAVNMLPKLWFPFPAVLFGVLTMLIPSLAWLLPSKGGITSEVHSTTPAAKKEANNPALNTADAQVRHRQQKPARVTANTFMDKTGASAVLL